VGTSYTHADNKTVKTAPSKPVFKAGSVTNNSLKISWTAAAGTSYYRLYSYTPSTKTYKILKQTSALSFTVTGLSGGTDYVYLVRAFNSSGAGSGYSTADHLSVKTVPNKPSFTLTAAQNSVKISWSSVKGASFYRIYGRNGSYFKIADVKTLSYTVSSLRSNTSYTYLVRAFDSQGRAVSYSLSDNKTIKTK
jgi:fibronectin type 3 domain-containing protein